MPVKEKLDIIQVLRGVAALLVVMLHGYDVLWDVSPSYQTAWGKALFFSGASGVDLFFIISGFIMVYTTTRSNATFKYTKDFWIKRFARIWPVYFVLTLLIGVHFSLQGLSDVLKSLAFQPLSNSDAPYFGRAALDVGWTLNYEMYFYLIFGLSMLFTQRWVVFFLIMLITLIAIPKIYFGYFTFNPYNVYGFSGYLNIMASPMIWEFVAGVCIGLIYKSKLKIHNLAILRSLLALSLAIFFWQYFSHYYSGFGIIFSGGSLVAVVFFLVIYNKTSPIHAPKFLVFLGDISFSLYLVHPLLLHLLHHLYTLHYDSLFIAILSFFPLLIVSSIILATLSYHYLEKGLCEKVRTQLLRYVG